MFTTSSPPLISELEGMEFEEDPRGSIAMDPDSRQADALTIIGTTSRDDVPYDGVGLDPSHSIGVDRETVVELLEEGGSDLPPGI